MPQINFVKDIPPISVEKGANLMHTLLAHGLPVASSCHGEGVCSKCRVRILAGTSNLSAETPLEVDLKNRNRVGADFRISCQTRVLNDIVIDTTYW